MVLMSSLRNLTSSTGEQQHLNGYSSSLNASDDHDIGHQTASTTNGGSKRCYVQPPIAIIGMACRLPGRCSTPNEFWDFMMRGGVAANDPPKSRFNLSGHFDASAKPQTMKTPGAMFMEHVDPADFDAQFFNINQSDAIAMDPQQRNLMEVAYECLENAGIPIEKLSGRRVGCLIGASAVGSCSRPFGTAQGIWADLIKITTIWTSKMSKIERIRRL